MSHAPGKWISYTPTWGGTGGTPSIGNGTLAGRYVKIGDLVHAEIDLIFGSSTTANSATLWTFDAPSNPASKVAGAATWRGTYYGVGTVLRESANAIYVVYGDGASASNFVGYQKPWTWADTHWLHLSFTYQA